MIRLKPTRIKLDSFDLDLQDRRLRYQRLSLIKAKIGSSLERSPHGALAGACDSVSYCTSSEISGDRSSPRYDSLESMGDPDGISMVSTLDELASLSVDDRTVNIARLGLDGCCSSSRRGRLVEQQAVATAPRQQTLRFPFTSLAATSSSPYSSDSIEGPSTLQYDHPPLRLDAVQDHLPDRVDRADVWVNEQMPQIVQECSQGSGDDSPSRRTVSIDSVSHSVSTPRTVSSPHQSQTGGQRWRAAWASECLSEDLDRASPAESLSLPEIGTESAQAQRQQGRDTELVHTAPVRRGDTAFGRQGHLRPDELESSGQRLASDGARDAGRNQQLSASPSPSQLTNMLRRQNAVRLVRDRKSASEWV